jgi:hypothetical protein
MTNRQRGAGLGIALAAFLGLTFMSGQFIPQPGGGGGGGAVSLAALSIASPGTETGQAIEWNGTAWQARISRSDPSLIFTETEEFTQTTTNCATIGANFIGTTSGTGAGCAVSTATAGHPGILALHVGSTNAGLARFRNNGLNTATGGSAGPLCSRWLAQWPTLSTVAQEYITRFGFTDALTSADGANTAELIYDRLNIGTMLALRNCATSVCNTVKLDGTGGTTLFTVPANVWHTYEVCINSAGTQTSAAIDGTVYATNGTNPPGQVSWGAQMLSTAGTTDNNFLIDYEVTRLPFSVAR